MEKYQNEGLNIIAEKYPDIDFSDVDGKKVGFVGAICKKLGINIELKNLKDGYCGYYDSEKNTIIVNNKQPATRQILTVAHELGHYILHNNVYHRCLKNYEGGHSCLKNPKHIICDVQREFEANSFAEKLLMPVNKFVESFYRNNGTLLDIACEFGVSVYRCELRAFNLGLIQ